MFPELGLSFWRGNVYTKVDVEADWFKALISAIQEDNKRYLYFETITLKKIAGFDSMTCQFSPIVRLKALYCDKIKFIKIEIFRGDE